MDQVLARLRTRKLDELTATLRRPTMWSVNGRELEHHLIGLLEDLGTIDGREDDIRELQRSLTRFGKLGVVGAFDAVFGSERSHAAEVASVLAEAAAGVGYIKPERVLAEAEWTRLHDAVRDRYEETDAQATEILEEWGEPSLRIDGRIFCYANHHHGWIFFDCWPDDRRFYDRSSQNYVWVRDENPLLRSVRVPGNGFDDHLVLTALGKSLRWGPGWTFRHGRTGDPYPSGVRSQLTEIEENDPSQSLGLRRP